MTGHGDTLPGQVRFTGLDGAQNYRVKAVWPAPIPTQSEPSIIEALGLDGEGDTVSGQTLMTAGFQAPLVYPETCVIYHLIANEGAR